MLTAKLKVKMDAQRKQQASAKKKIANALEARDEDRKPEPKLSARVASTVVEKKKASVKAQSTKRKPRKKG